jgi:hypothetical protein
MKKNRMAKRALQKATADSDTFVDTAILFAPGVGRGALNNFMAAGWIRPDMMDGLRQTYRITVAGRAALATALDEARGV